MSSWINSIKSRMANARIERTAYTKLAHKLADHDNEIAQLGSQIGDVANKHAYLVSRVDGIDNTIVELRAADHTMAGQITTLDSEVVVINTAISSIDAAITNTLFCPGFITPCALTTAPAGFVFCDGAAYSRSTYASLYNVIGTTFGAGNTTTTFNVPDMRNRFAIGKSSSYALGTTGGNATVGLVEANLPIHNHTGTSDSAGNHGHSVNDGGHGHNIINSRDDGNSSNNVGQSASGDGNVPGANTVLGHGTESATTGITINTSGSHSHSYTTSNFGSSSPSAVTILNPYLALNYIIKF